MMSVGVRQILNRRHDVIHDEPAEAKFSLPVIIPKIRKDRCSCDVTST